MFLDLDHFKDINDTRGHDAGDLLLIEVARRLLGVSRECDTVSRQGGDEFVVLLNNLAEAQDNAARQATHVAEKIRKCLCRPYEIQGEELRSSPSIGLSLFIGQSLSQDTLFKQADIALYAAKSAGKNTVRLFTATMTGEEGDHGCADGQVE